MYNFFYNIGSSVIGFFTKHFSFTPKAFVESLPLLLEGMIGIFLVMAIIFLAIWGLQKISK